MDHERGTFSLAKEQMSRAEVREEGKHDEKKSESTPKPATNSPCAFP